jgi:elongation factor P
MPLAKELKRGLIVEFDGAPCIVEKIEVKSPSARGANTLYKVRARDLGKGIKVDKVFDGTDLIPDADFERRAIQYLYHDGEDYHFMDEENGNQFALSNEQMGEQASYITENMGGLTSMLFNGEPIGIQLPPVIEMEIVDTNPAVKGSSATGRTKPAKLVTGLVVQVPEYLSNGEVVRIDTETGQFLARADSK